MIALSPEDITTIQPASLVIGIDPGFTTGVAGLWCVAKELRVSWVNQCASSQDVIDEIHTIWSHCLKFGVPTQLRLAIERFVLSPRAARVSYTKPVQLTQTVIESVIGEFQRSGSIHLRAAVAVKPWATDSRLHALGLLDASIGLPHARDAVRHALYEAVHAGLLPDPLSKKVTP